MDLPIELLLGSAPERQRYLRAVHILFNSVGDALKANARQQLLMATANDLTRGLSVADFCQFRRKCFENEDWCKCVYPLLEQDENVVADRAEAAVQEALSAVRFPGGGESSTEPVLVFLSTSKRSRSEIEEEFEIPGKLRLAEVFANVGDYGAMYDTLTHLFVPLQSGLQLTARSHRLPLLLLQLQVIKRTTELWLGAGNVEAVRGYVGESTSTVLTDAVQAIAVENGSGSVYFPSHQVTVEAVTDEIEQLLLFFSIVRALCLFESGDFCGFVCSFTPEGLRGTNWAQAAGDMLVERGATQVAASFGGRISRPGVLPAIHNLRRVVEESVTTGVQLGAMLLLSAVATRPRAEAMELVTRIDIMQLWEDIPEAHTLVHALQQANFADALHAASVLAFVYLKTDLFAYKHCECLLYQYKQTVIMRYVSCFISLDLKRAAMHLSIPLRELVHIVRELIEKEHISAKIDLVAYMLVSADAFSPTDTAATDRNLLFDCINRSRKCAEELEQSLRLLSAQRDNASSGVEFGP
ncbi:uncharacterized protein TEOVI_000647300 [Trypanosoma equiperdum]|uniref:PCI domain-containing protein n=1 Tax=Trypanosoma equiperdum TaxID=5694 RepID=A0A1G4I1R8_TRYEQ|nr:hypothetical protein, conserved [Trypanosoma equiperdum]